MCHVVGYIYYQKKTLSMWIKSDTGHYDGLTLPSWWPRGTDVKRNKWNKIFHFLNSKFYLNNLRKCWGNYIMMWNNNLALMWNKNPGWLEFNLLTPTPMNVECFHVHTYVRKSVPPMFLQIVPHRACRSSSSVPNSSQMQASSPFDRV